MHPGALNLIKEFGRISVDAEALEHVLSTPEPRLQYLVLFTPRSGSSWLTELLSSNPGFGQPSEWFNDSLIPDVARHVGVDNMFDYISVVKRSMADAQTDTFGAEVTYFQLEVMRQLIDFFQHFPMKTTKLFYLNRRDIVAQAVSLYRAVKSGVFHSTDVMPDNSPKVEFNIEEIDYWLEHIRQQEHGVESLLIEHCASVHRITYEDMMAGGANSTLQVFSQALHSAPYTNIVVAPKENTRLSSDESIEWIERYRTQRPILCARLAAERFAD